MEVILHQIPMHKIGKPHRYLLCFSLKTNVDDGMPFDITQNDTKILIFIKFLGKKYVQLAYC